MISSWAIYTQRIDIQSVYVCSVLKTTVCIDVLFVLYFTNYSCKYYEILGYDHDMYVIKYVCMLGIYISQMNIRSAENIYIYKVQYQEY